MDYKLSRDIQGLMLQDHPEHIREKLKRHEALLRLKRPRQGQLRLRIGGNIRRRADSFLRQDRGASESA